MALALAGLLCVAAILTCVFVQYVISPMWLRSDPSFRGECCRPVPGAPRPAGSRLGECTRLERKGALAQSFTEWGHPPHGDRAWGDV